MSHVKLTQLEAYSKALDTIESTYKTETGRKFIHHLIDSFIESDIILIPYSGKELFDCITKSKLNTVYNKEFPCEDQDIISLLNQSKEADKTEKVKLLLQASNIIRERYPNINLSRVAIRSGRTNKIIGMEEFQALTEFTQDQVNNGNRTIIKMIKYARFRTKPEFKEEDPTKSKEALDTKLQDLVNKFKK